MKYSTEIIIHLPLDKVIGYFDSVENLYKWQEGLLSFKHLEGEPGQEGSSSELVYEGRRGDLRMKETITKRGFPDEFHATYRARGVTNEMYNYFSVTTDGHTRWRTRSVFRFRGLMALMAPFMKQAFIANTRLNMERFKAFAENVETL